MNHGTQVELITRVLRHRDEKTTDTAASTREPVATYLDGERFEQELRMLRTHPLAIGHASDVREPGTFLTHDALGRSVIVARDLAGELRAHLNVCRHRGTRVELSERGHAKCFRCPYHAWTYGLDGRLLGAPHRRGFPGIDEGTHSLVPVPVREDGGLIWIGGESPLPAVLKDELDGFGLTSGTVFDRRRWDYALGWKLVFDIFLEAYHVRIAHEDTIAPMFLDNIYLVDRFDPHIRTAFPKRSVDSLRELPSADWRVRQHANVLYVLFPNTLVLVEPDHSAVLHVFPKSIDRTVIESYLVVPEPPSPKAERYWLANSEVLYSATAEDFAIGESIQSGLRSGANDALTFGEFEHGLSLFHLFVRKALSASQ